MLCCCCLSLYLPSQQPCSLSLSLIRIPAVAPTLTRPPVATTRKRNIRRSRPKLSAVEAQQQTEEAAAGAAATNAEQQLHTSYLLWWWCCLSLSLMYLPSRQPQKKHESVYFDQSSRRPKLSADERVLPTTPLVKIDRAPGAKQRRFTAGPPSNSLTHRSLF